MLGKYKHYKGGTYTLIHIARLESNLADVAVYQSHKEGTVYVRPVEEFFGELKDGAGGTTRRFIPVEASGRSHSMGGQIKATAISTKLKDNE